MSCHVQRAVFGALPGGAPVEAITLTAGGVTATILTLGATIQSVRLPDRQGELTDVVPGFDSLDAYLEQTQYFGVTVGRVANRIAGGRFTLDGRDYRVPTNNGPNSLHGGAPGFDKANWEITSTEDGPEASVTLRLVSPDGDQGYPGSLTVTATYSLDAGRTLSVEYLATADAPTLVNSQQSCLLDAGR